MKTLLNTPQEELLAILKERNPLLKVTDATTVIPYKVIPSAVGGKNTQVQFYIKASSGVQGLGTINLNRIDPGKMFNLFNEVNKTPTVRIFAAVGATISPLSVIDQINTALGIKLSTSGNFADVTSTNVTVPAKGGAVAATLKTSTVTTGVPPFSLRLLPNCTLNVSLFNAGSKISDGLVLRNAAPYKNALGNLNWGITALNPVAATLRYYPIELFNVDFTDAFGTSLAAAIMYIGYTGSTYRFRFTDAALASINAALTERDLPNIPNTWYWTGTSSSVTTMAASMLLTTASTTSVLVNDTFSHYVAISSSAFPADGSLVGTSLILHYNLLA